MSKIKSEFLEAVSRHSADAVKARSLWTEIEQAYSHRKRFYHTLDHLESLLEVLSRYTDHFENWDVIVFAIVYHDLVYNVVKSNNEERSAETAVQRLKEISVSPQLVEFCRDLILATKKHRESTREINLFTDADLSILGANEGSYLRYSENVRKEYSIFPDLIYNAGRKKVVMHFLEMKRIFKTVEFFDQFENRARTNLELELATLK